MKYKIGFSAESQKGEGIIQNHSAVIHMSEPRKSVVRVHFPTRNMTLAYGDCCDNQLRLRRLS